LRTAALLLVCVSLCFGQNGVPIRRQISNYAAQAGDQEATLAASLLSPAEVKRFFAADLNKRYYIVEVAIYPKSGAGVDVDRYDFGLKSDDRVAHADTPREVVSIWQEKFPGLARRGPAVTVDESVVYASGRDPVTGQKQHGVGTYSDVTVANDDRQRRPDPPANSGPDPYAIEASLRDKALKEGRTSTPIAGYLYFPRIPKAPKSGKLELEHSNPSGTVVLSLPAK
jgi:hypothetical protein